MDHAADPVTADASDADQAPLDPAEFWEQRYSDSERVWSGNVNKVLADIAVGLEPGRALDLGSGEGGDVIWLAERGWTATGVDISPTAVRRATEAARAAGISEDRAGFIAADLADLAELDGVDQYELVTASFLHSPVELVRTLMLRVAADLVAPGGHLLITSHMAYPPGAKSGHHHEPHFLTPDEEIDALDLDEADWETVVAEVRSRDITTAEGESATLDDAVVLLRRR